MRKLSKHTQQRLLVVFVGIVMLAFCGGWHATAHAASEGITMADPVAQQAGHRGQMELAEFEQLTGSTLTFSDNPLFADRVKSGDLPSVAERLPDEPLVIIPYDSVGKYGGTLYTVANALESGTSEILSARHSALVRFDDTLGTIIPHVAKEYSINDELNEITFVLRKGHKWSDGEPFTVDDILFWANDIVNNKELHPSTPNPWHVGMKAVKVDELTVKLVFDESFPSALHYIAGGGSYHVTIAPKHYLVQFHKDYNADVDEIVKKEKRENWVDLFHSKWHRWMDAIQANAGGINFPTLESHIMIDPPTTQERINVANPYYFAVDTAGQQLPYINRQHEAYVPNEVKVLKASNGEVTYGAQNFKLKDYPVYKKSADAKGYSIQLPARDIGPAYMLNPTVEDPVLREIFADPNFATALSIAIDREELLETEFLGLPEPGQITVIGAPYVPEEYKTHAIEYDFEKAGQILDEMGLKMGPDGIRLRPDGNPLRITKIFSTDEGKASKMDLMLQGYWKDLGIDFFLKAVSNEERRARVNSNQIDIFEGWGYMTESAAYMQAADMRPPFTGDGFRVAGPWGDWMRSDGAEGEEPPQWAKNLWDKAEQLTKTAYRSDEYMTLGREIADIFHEHMIVFGVANEVVGPAIVGDQLKNMPELKRLSWYSAYVYPYRPEQWFLAE